MSATTIQQNNCHITTDIYSSDSVYAASEDVIEMIAEAFTKTVANAKGIEDELQAWQEQNPGIPQFKNFHALYHLMHRNKQKAHKLNSELLQQFPDYLYAIINAASQYIEEGDKDKAKAILGADLSLSSLLPKRAIFHFEEYFLYNTMLIKYYCKTDDIDKAKQILKDLREVKEKLQLNTDFSEEENLILVSRINKEDTTPPDMRRSNEHERSEPTLLQTEDAPAFHFTETEALYQYGFLTMPDELIKKLLKKEKIKLREDLETVVYDAIKRFKYFEKKDLGNDENAFCLHAVFLLKEIKAEESLPVVLELLRQPDEVLNFWLFDLLTENFWQVLYVLGLPQTDKLVSYLKEPLNYTFARSEVSIVLAQIALHHPERKAEIVNAYKNLLQYFLQHKGNEQIFESTLVGLIIGDILDIGATELLPHIKALYDAGVVDESVNGSWDEIARLKNLELIDKRPLQTYFEIKEDIAEWEKTSDVDAYETDDWELAENINEVDDVLFIKHAYAVDMPKMHPEQDCYCGSGKLFKNCHGKG